MNAHKPQTPAVFKGSKSLNIPEFTSQPNFFSSRPRTFDQKSSNSPCQLSEVPESKARQHTGILIASALVKISKRQPLSPTEDEALKAHIHAMRLSTQ